MSDCRAAFSVRLILSESRLGCTTRLPLVTKSDPGPTLDSPTVTEDRSRDALTLDRLEKLRRLSNLLLVHALIRGRVPSLRGLP